MNDLEKLCSQVISVAKEAGVFIAAEVARFDRSMVEVKGVNNFVSFVDKQAEKLIIDRLSVLLPEAGFITEEETRVDKADKYNWVIDPLDGTTNFIHGLPPYSVSIGLMDNNEVILGVIYEVTLKECFYSWKGAPSYLDGKVIHVSATQQTKDALVATGFPYYNFSLLESALKMLGHLFVHSHGVRRIGSAAADMAYLACGRFDVFYEYGLQPWDVAAADIIVRNAGGTITDYSGGSDYIFGKRIVVTNGPIHEEFLEIIRRFFDLK